MNIRRFIAAALLIFAFFASSALTWAADEETPLEFTRLDLTDGRKLKNVVVRSYDAGSDRFLVLADRKAMTLAATLIPAAIAEKLKVAAPKSGSSVSSTSRSPDSATSRRPPPPNRAQPSRANEESAERQRIAAHREAAIEKARTFYRYEYKVGSDAIRVQSVRVEAAAATPVPGWAGRYRTSGTAHLEIFDTKGWSATRATSSFEIVTEEKPNEPIVVVEFNRKS